MPLIILGVIALLVWYVGKKSVSCGVMIGILAAFGLIAFIILTSQITITGTGTIH